MYIVQWQEGNNVCMWNWHVRMTLTTTTLLDASSTWTVVPWYCGAIFTAVCVLTIRQISIISWRHMVYTPSLTEQPSPTITWQPYYIYWHYGHHLLYIDKAETSYTDQQQVPLLWTKNHLHIMSPWLRKPHCINQHFCLLVLTHQHIQ